jgi:UDP-4-amino-4,6-dideoxy-N-acetyl-beta-L-altrosamine transaminase
VNQTLPVRHLPYGRQSIGQDDIDAVVAALQADYLTTGPRVPEFESALCAITNAQEAVAVSNGTAALHLAARAAGLVEGTWTIVPAITFLATANAVRLTGGDVIFADVDPATGLMTPETFKAALDRAPGPVKAAIPVHFAGPSADMSALATAAAASGITLIEDAAHAIGSNRPDGTVGDCTHSRMSCFSFHPVKTVTTGEGGAVTTNDPYLARALRRDRSHGMTREAAEFLDQELSTGKDGLPNPWSYEMHGPGLNYRLTDLQAALGLSQLKKLPAFIAARQALKTHYDALLGDFAPDLRTPAAQGSMHAWHLYPVRIDFERLGKDRAVVMRRLAAKGVGTQVHYIPLHWQPYYAARYGRQTLPGAERYYRQTLSLPLFPQMTHDDVDYVICALLSALGLR